MTEMEKKFNRKAVYKHYDKFPERKSISQMKYHAKKLKSMGYNLEDILREISKEV